jgi:hypothetical protein
MITRSGWIRLGALAFIVALGLFILCAPMATMSITVSLPPSSTAPTPPTPAEWFNFALILGGVLGLIGLIVFAIWLAIRTARGILRDQPRKA